MTPEDVQIARRVIKHSQIGPENCLEGKDIHSAYVIRELRRLLQMSMKELGYSLEDSDFTYDASLT